MDENFLERSFKYIPHVIDLLLSKSPSFSYDEFILKLSTFIDDGTRQLISQTDTGDIRKLLEIFCQKIRAGKFIKKKMNPKETQIMNLKTMDPYDFEKFIGELFVRLGFKSLYTVGRAGDRGVDLIGEDPEGQSVIIQCKRYNTSNVAAEPIQRLHSFAVTRSINRKIAVTTTNFTRHASEEANLTNTELINGDDLLKLIEKSKLGK